MKQSLLKSRDLLPICFLSLAVTQILLVLFGVKIVFDQNAISAKMYRTLVQEENGTTFVAETYPSSQRSPGAIKSFVRDWLKEQYSFSGVTLDQEGKMIKDLGIKVESVRVPLRAYSGSFAVPAESRNDFIKSLINEWLPQDYFSENPTIVEIQIDEMSEPRLDKKQNIWEVIVIAQLNYQTPANAISVKKFRRIISLKPIAIPQTKISDIAPFSERLAYQWRSRGLKVVGLEEYK